MTSRSERTQYFDRWLFAPVDPRAAAAFRVGFAFALALIFWPEMRAPDPRIAHSAVGRLYPGLFLSEGWWLATLVTFVLWCAGVRTRVLGFVLVALLLPRAFLSGVTRSSQILLVTLASFSLVRSDLEWSILARRWRPCARDSGPIWPIRLLQIQLSASYLVNAVAKTTPAYLSGDALVGMAARLPNFLVDLSDGSLHLGPLAIPVWICAALTVAVEYTLAIGFWLPRARWAVALLGIAFHVSLHWVVVIGWLDVASIVLYAAFLVPFARSAINERSERATPLGI